MTPLMKLLYVVWSARKCMGLGIDARLPARCREAMALLQGERFQGMEAAIYSSGERLLPAIWASRVYGKVANLFVAGRLCESVAEQLNRLTCEVTPL